MTAPTLAEAEAMYAEMQAERTRLFTGVLELVHELVDEMRELPTGTAARHRRPFSTAIERLALANTDDDIRDALIRVAAVALRSVIDLDARTSE